MECQNAPQASSIDVWQKHAKQWRLFAPPLRPSPEDTSVVQREVWDVFKQNAHSHLSALLMGVTPELALMDWPEPTHLTAIDCCPHMIDHVFPHTQMKLSHFKVLCGDWRDLPLADHSTDIVVGDGCYAFVRFPDDFHILSKEIRRILSPRGRFVTRLFIRPEKKDLPEQIFADLFAKKIKNFHILKWKLVVALHGDLSQGVCLGDVWKLWDAQSFSMDQLVQEFGWDKETLATMDNYRNSMGHYFFPTLQEAKNYFETQFQILRIEHPSYELGDRFPSFVLAEKNRKQCERLSSLQIPQIETS